MSVKSEEKMSEKTHDEGLVWTHVVGSQLKKEQTEENTTNPFV